MRKWLAMPGALLGLLLAVPARAEWTALISSGDFTGIKTDVGTAAAGLISVCLIVLGVGMLIRAFGR